MIKSKQDFIKLYENEIRRAYEKPVSACNDREKFDSLVTTIRKLAIHIRNNPGEGSRAMGEKKVYYFSMEFLIGKLLENYLICLGIKDYVEEGLADLGESLERFCEMEPDPGLGNGGLGRLAACFLESMAATGVVGDGMGLRYHFGLFRQKIVDGYQTELPDNWLDQDYPWELARPAKAITVNFGGHIERHFREDGNMDFEYVDATRVKAIPYNVPVIGYGGKDVNTLHLWEACLEHETLDMEEFNEGNYDKAFKKKCDVEALTSVLYPDDSKGIGRRLRLRQEYFLVAAGMGFICNEYVAKYGPDQWHEFPERVAIHINDTHPTLCIPELMRILLDEKKLGWDEAWEITTNTISFTNHTVLPEALERWTIPEVKDLLPRVYMIIEEINRRWQDGLDQSSPDYMEIAAATAPLWANQVRMANLSVIGSNSVNGVSELHSDIITETIFKDFYKLNPEKFNNKTNGISPRRFLFQANPSLTGLITEKIGPGWLTDMDKIAEIGNFREDSEFLDRLAQSKYENKVRLAEYVKKHQGIDIDPNSVFDVQVKRIHAYKRQMLMGLKILDLYNRLKENPDLPINNYTFIVAGKAAQGYAFAKEVIKFINSLGDLINNDPDVNGKIKVVFIENFCVSNAQLIYPAADISEQISTAGKEASGTGNMKFMMNGAVTLGTMDGANVEIHRLVGEDNIKIFGMRSDEVQNYYDHGGYSSKALCKHNPRINRLMQQLVDGTFEECSGCNFWGIYDALVTYNDEFFVLEDFESYVNAWEELDKTYNDKQRWGGMSLANIAGSSFFSSDRTIKEYAEEIWHTDGRR
ncbi:MAG: glycogen/starch/alpha-glucan phosphorylase [Firmicutes bacterium]|nr:glycogen/starch/alpha-glucan phosphorylase [Bacillota bacterium]